MGKYTDILKNKFCGKTVSVIGMGISNMPLIKLLLECGADVTVRDRRTKEQIGSLPYGCRYVLGEGYLDNLNESCIFRTPGLRYDTPQLVKASENGSVITSEMEVFFDICPANIIAVTGSDGKTTTTTLISELIKKGGKRCFVGGNIGKPLLPEIDSITPDDAVVLELSSFQLHTMKKSPHIAVITNLSPNHLDYHKSYEEYIEAKTNIFMHQSPNDTVILNYDNADTRKLEKSAPGNVLFFSRRSENGVHLEGNYIVYNGEKLLNINKINGFKGRYIKRCAKLRRSPPQN